MTSDSTTSVIPEAKASYDEAAWADTEGAVEEIKAATTANTNGLSASIEGKVQTLRRQTSDLRSLRQARKLTQQQLAAADERFSQAQVSKLESSDPLTLVLSTLRRFVEASGGTLLVSAEFEDDTYVFDFDDQKSRD